MATQFEIDCALMAGRAYQTNRDPDGINWLPVPVGWLEIQHVPNPAISTIGGFEMSAFQNINNSGEIVISYAGTDGFFSVDQFANLGLATGRGSDQLLQAVDYYLQVRKDNPNANITFTGRSVGGGLAALMGVFFGRQAVTFDQAPFANTAEQGLFGTPSYAVNLKTYLLGKSYTNPAMVAVRDALVADLDNFLTLQQTNGGIPNSDLVSTIRVQGEFTSSFPVGTLFDPIGTLATFIQHGPTDISSVTELHTQSLLTAFLQSQQTAAIGQALNDVTFKLTDLLGMIFDPKLFANSTDTDKRNLLEHLVRHEAGVQGSFVADAMLTRFNSDLWKIAQDGGLTMRDGHPTNPDLNFLSKALTAFAMQKYYEETSGSGGYRKELFTDLATAGEGSGGIRFDMANVSAKFATAFAQGDRLNLSDAKGFEQYFKAYLQQSTFTDAERQAIQAMLPNLRDWYVQAGAGGMNATDTLNRGAFMLGGAGAETLTGGSAADLLVGNAGADVLLGGTGNDSYQFSGLFGLDTVLGSDGQGSLNPGTTALSGGKQIADGVWESDDKQYRYTQVEGQLIVSLAATKLASNPVAANDTDINWRVAA